MGAFNELYTPEVHKIFGEFLAADPLQGDQLFKDAWSARDDLGEAMTPYLEAERSALEKASGSFQDALATNYPDARFWQIALFRTCARRAFRRLELTLKQNDTASLTALPTFGMF